MTMRAGDSTVGFTALGQKDHDLDDGPRRRRTLERQLGLELALDHQLDTSILCEYRSFR